MSTITGARTNDCRAVSLNEIIGNDLFCRETRRENEPRTAFRVTDRRADRGGSSPIRSTKRGYDEINVLEGDRRRRDPRGRFKLKLAVETQTRTQFRLTPQLE